MAPARAGLDGAVGRGMAEDRRAAAAAVWTAEQTDTVMWWLIALHGLR